MPQRSAWMRYLSLTGFCFVLAGCIMGAACSPKVEAENRDEPAVKPGLPALKQAADAVLADPDGVRAAKSVGKIFEAAHALRAANDPNQAAAYFERGLQLSPWRLAEQLSYAELLLKLGRVGDAGEIARMVDGRAETDALCNQARKLLERVPVPPAVSTRTLPVDGAFVCLIQVGPVNQVGLKASVEKLHQTLGVPVLVIEGVISPGQSQRSAFDHWVKNSLAKQVNWEIPQMSKLLTELGMGRPAELTADQTLAVIREALKRSEQKASLEAMEEESAFYRKNDLQWDAGKMTETLQKFVALPSSSKGVIIGITEADLYAGTSNYVFGMAPIGGRVGIVSYARYRADFFGEPPDLGRLTRRMHKQLLSTVGNALGVPRPTDPTSARSYPASLPEHDAKSEYMSTACIAGFERAWGIKLPLTSHKPAGAR